MKQGIAGVGRKDFQCNGGKLETNSTVETNAAVEEEAPSGLGNQTRGQ